MKSRIMLIRMLEASFNSCHSEFYKIQEIFKLLPGHRDLILSLSELFSQNNDIHDDPDKFLIQATTSAFVSYIERIVENGLTQCNTYKEEITIYRYNSILFYIHISFMWKIVLQCVV